MPVNEEGMKFDSEKPRAALVLGGFADALLDVSKVGTFGAKKYAPNNWKKVEPERYEDALFRHLLAWQSTKPIDEETGLPHLAHAAWNILAILQLSHKPVEVKWDVDKFSNKLSEHLDRQLKLPLEFEGGYDEKGAQYVFGRRESDD